MADGPDIAVRADGPADATESSTMPVGEIADAVSEEVELVAVEAFDLSDAGGAAPTESATDALADDESRDPWSSWSNLWQVPAILLALVLIGHGLSMVGRQAPREDWDGVFAEVEGQIAEGDLDSALERLKRVIEPNIGHATDAQRGRFHRCVADYVVARQIESGSEVKANFEAIDEHYELAEADGADLNPRQVEHWARAHIALGHHDRARDLIHRLEEWSLAGLFEGEARRRRNRVLRRLVNVYLRRNGTEPMELITMLDEYRQDPQLEAIDIAWAAAQQARLRLALNEPAEAVDHLVVDVRRLEAAEPPLDGGQWGELITQLGRGYAAQGRYDEAKFHFDQALARLEPPDPERAEALVERARLHLSEDEAEEALVLFDETVVEYPGAEVWPHALLGRAEAESILGDHELSLRDFDQLLDHVARFPLSRADTRLVARRLVDRHDAAIAIGAFERALEYTLRAERLFDPKSVPEDVLVRIASASFQLGTNSMDAAFEELVRERSASAMGAVGPEDVAPEIRYAAYQLFDRSAQYFLRHAQVLAGSDEAGDVSAMSLRRAAEAHDLGGRPDRAIDVLDDYIGGLATDDPMYGESSWKLARALHAEKRYEEAAQRYESVLEAQASLTFGTQVHVPLARCYVALDRIADAKRQLLAVVEGRQAGKIPLLPHAPDYQNALVELGTLHHEQLEYREAIERLTMADELIDPNEPRMLEVRYRLADSHWRFAAGLDEQLEEPTGRTPTERADMTARARDHRRTAQSLFTAVCAGYAEVDERMLDRFQRQLERGAWLGRAHCAYDLGDFAGAVDLYDRAARRFGDDVAALEALVQIVNCFNQLGDQRQADIAHRNVLTRLRQLPDEAFEDPRTLMRRRTWEEWLRARPAGDLAQAATES